MRMNETRKLNAYRKENGYDAYFTGHGIDIGCGPDPLDVSVFTLIKTLKKYDTLQGDANTCENLADNSFDFVYSSHCLEHMHNVHVALKNWIRICKLNGFVVFAVPHEVYYEKNQWPSPFNNDHKFSFRLEPYTVMPKSIWMQELLSEFTNIKVINCSLLLINFDAARFWNDQTLGETVCQIEVILKKC